MSSPNFPSVPPWTEPARQNPTRHSLASDQYHSLARGQYQQLTANSKVKAILTEILPNPVSLEGRIDPLKPNSLPGTACIAPFQWTALCEYCSPNRLRKGLSELFSLKPERKNLMMRRTPSVYSPNEITALWSQET